MKAIAQLLIVLILAVICNQEAEGINYQGTFDSMNQDSQQQQDQPYQQQEDSVYEQEQQDMLQFSEHMADFFPDQTFTFKLQPSERDQFMLWPGSDVETIRGMFHSEVTGDEDSEGYVNLALYDNDQQVRNYIQQRLGIFNIPHTHKDHRYIFRFDNSESPSQVYFSYEFVTKQKRESKVQRNETQILAVTRKFQKVNKLIVQQQSQMKRLMDISEKHNNKVDHYLSSVLWTLLFETIIIAVGNTISLWLLKKQLYAGYQLLV